MGPIFSKLRTTLRTNQEKVDFQGNHPMGDAYYVYGGYMQHARDNFLTTAANNMLFVALITNCRHNVFPIVPIHLRPFI